MQKKSHQSKLVREKEDTGGCQNSKFLEFLRIFLSHAKNEKIAKFNIIICTHTVCYMVDICTLVKSMSTKSYCWGVCRRRIGLGLGLSSTLIIFIAIS